MTERRTRIKHAKRGKEVKEGGDRSILNQFLPEFCMTFHFLPYLNFMEIMQKMEYWNFPFYP